MVLNTKDVVIVDFPGVTGIKRRPAVILSSATYHATRQDIIVGLITSQTKELGATDYILQDWAAAGLRVESIFRSFIITLPRSANIIQVGHLSERDWQAIRACIKVSFANLDDGTLDRD
jgi:mRNA interferase MazF